MKKNDTSSKNIKGFLSSAFTKVAKATGIVLGAYTLPLGGKNSSTLLQIAILLGTAYITQPLTSGLFPSAEEFLEQQGVPSSIATDLTEGNKTYIRSDDTMGTLHSLMDIPNVFYASYIYLTSRNGTENSYSIPPLHSSFNCRVSSFGTPDDNKDTKEILDTISRLPHKLIENTGISYEELYYFILFHEMRHCSNTNKSLEQPYKEADADYHAIRATEKLFKNTQIAKFVLNFRALVNHDLDANHDTSLYLNAKLKGKEPPDIGRTYLTNILAETIINSNILTIQPLSKVDNISKFVRERIELHINALKFFTKKQPMQKKAQIRKF